MTTQPNIFGDQVRCHHAKPFFGMPHPDFPNGGMVAYLRKQYQDAGTWERFLAMRRELDPDGMFLNDHLRLWFGLPKAAPTVSARAAGHQPIPANGVVSNA